MRFSVVIPCYNEADNLPALIEKSKKLSEYPDVEVIFVNNGSTDNSVDVFNKLIPSNSRLRVITVDKNQGYGYGILAGLRAASGDVLGWTHADMQTDPQDFLAGITIFNKNNKNIFVKGQRRGRPLFDVVFTIGMSFFESILLGEGMWDINAQPTMFSRDFFLSWDSPPYDFSLDLYAYYMAKKKNIPVHRFTVYFGKRLHGISHWNTDFAAKAKFIKRTVIFSLKLKRGLN